MTRVFRAPVQDDVVAVDGVSMRIGAGEFVALVGPSGCGKSTILRMMAGLDQPDSGHVRVGGGTDGRLSYVFQDAHLLPWRSVADNVRLPLELAGVARDASGRAALDSLSAVGLRDFATRYPSQLSGGMRMRVSLARALVSHPHLLLLDEPFGALDEITRHSLQEQLRQLWLGGGLTVVFVTHSIAEATFLADRVVVFTPRPARVVLDHHVSLPVARDAALRTDASFAAEMRVIQDALRRGGAIA